MYYRDANNDGIEDETKIPADQLKPYRYNDVTGAWEELLDMTVDKGEKRVYARTPAFSNFALGGPASAASSSSPRGAGECIGSVALQAPGGMLPVAALAISLFLAATRRGFIKSLISRMGRKKK
jgi:hypothetical protein